MSKAWTPIDIKKYTTPFIEYPLDFIHFCNQHSIKMPQLNNNRGQALALLVQEPVRGREYVNGRVDSTAFIRGIGKLEQEQDPIQYFNKTFGLKPMNLGKSKYALVYPWVIDKIEMDKRKGVFLVKEDTMRDESIQAIKEYYTKNIIDIPNDQWQKGHLDPTIGDSSSNNFAYQPPIQSKYRNRFKWDSRFFKMWPTGAELMSNMDRYYTKEEQLHLLEFLQKTLK